ncbi:glutamate-1-semialdehyde 2,1-aminomutase [Kineococcus rhizosphaerae]|uniref:Glutamate-1-semialdehyde 2,1-aminomutase n=1 Tax=Kineococcus rhizosphaerae TaxID=559628 RepID=A0A2T0QUW8_9ACTN|nr:glutamate-1-semialdehyde 2,1-aminomutase [Kineococcus rhizosphaerae]
MQHLERARASIGGGVTSGLRSVLQPQPLSFTSGRGSRLFDVDGNEYVDYVLGWGPVILGHAHPAVTDAVTAQVPRGQLFGGIHPGERIAAEKLLSAVPAFERVLWSNTGTEAIQVAIRLARAATGRNLIVKTSGAYHGWHDSVLLSYRGHRGGHEPVLATRGQNPRSVDDVRVVEFNDREDLAEFFGAHGQEVAAVLLDPVLSNTGVIAPDPDYLRDLRSTCDAHGALLVFDEVITGFRVALGGAVELYGTIPDLAVYAKALGNGFSVAAVAGRADVVDLVEQGCAHSGTYNGNALAMAAVSATLTELSRPGVHEQLWQTAGTLAEGLRRTFRDRRVRAHVHHLGPIVQVLPGVTDAVSPREFEGLDWSVWDRWSRRLSQAGLFLLPNGRMFLSTAHSSADIDVTLNAFGALDPDLLRG